MKRYSAAFWLMLALVAGCDLSSGDMGQQPSAATGKPSDFFLNGAAARPPVPGTVSRDPDAAHPGALDVLPLATANPYPINRALIDRGQLQFTIHCTPCHGQLGNGMGMIVQRGFSRPPSFYAPRLMQAPDAHFYNVVTHGIGAMFSYADHLAPPDRWAVVAYIRALQSSPDIAQLPAGEREILQASYDPNAPPKGAP